ncbi:uncharacterized protein [Drosophila tropicalis]|uniref:uncharacterized protein n=1 Tax=Drosophila tropicalis TaxID=46794 RepID=UPI0035AB8DE6
MPTSRILWTRHLLGSMATTAMTRPCSVRQHMSKASLFFSAIYRFVNASRVFAAARDGIEEVPAPAPKHNKLEQQKLTEDRNMEALKKAQEVLENELVNLSQELESKEKMGKELINKYDELLEKVLNEGRRSTK